MHADHFFYLWLLPPLVVVPIAVLFWFSRFSRRRAQGDLKELRFALRGLQSRRKRLEKDAKPFSGRDPEPYRTLFIRFQEGDAVLRHQSENLERRLIALNELQTSLKSNKLWLFLGNPQIWQSHRKEAARLRREIVAAQSNLLKSEQNLDELKRIPWQVGEDFRAMHRDLETTAQIFNRLRSRGLHGETFEHALSQVNRIQSAFSEAPGDFFETDETILLRKVEKEVTGRIHEMIRDNRPILDQLMEQSQTWEKEYLNTSDAIFTMCQALDMLDQELVEIPEGFVEVDDQAVFSLIKETAHNLQVKASKPAIDNLLPIGEEAKSLMEVISKQTQDLRKARREFLSLEALLGELTAEFHRLSAELAELGAARIHPIQWELSLKELAALNREANAIGPANKARTLAEVSADMAAASNIFLQQQELGRHIREVEKAHKELTTLLETHEISQIPRWIQSARKLAGEVGTYALENWPRSDDAPDFQKDIDILAQQVDRLVSGDYTAFILETDIDSRLSQTTQLVRDYRRLTARDERLRQRLEELQNLEGKAGELLADLQKNLGQIRLIASSNRFLAGAALPEMDLLVRNVQEVAAELAQPQRGRVDKKFRQAAGLAERVETSAGRWMGLLNKEIQLQLKELAQSVGELDAIALLEDASLEGARQLLSSDDAFAVSQPTSQARLSLQGSILEFKRRSSFWQECTAAQRSLENVRQLVDTYREAIFQRNQARDQITGSGIPDKRAWPPAATTLEVECQEYDNLEREWTSLKDCSGKAISFVAQYSSLASRYQNLTERLRQGLSAREKEQRNVEQLEGEISGRAEPWRLMLSSYRDNPHASREIRALLDQLRKYLAEIKNDYLSGELEYDGVIQEMKSLQRQVRDYQIALDDEHSIDSSGRVTRRR